MKSSLLFALLGLLVAVLWTASLAYGTVPIPPIDVVRILLGQPSDPVAWSTIVLESRLPQATTALLVGASLAAAGLLLQTLFRNPLAGPSILGISDGANLGVAIVMLFFGGTIGLTTGGAAIGGSLALILAAFAGACCVLALIIYFSTRVSGNVMLLILGIMVGYLASSLISLLNFYASADRIRGYVMWGMGDFSSVSNTRLPFFALCTLGGLIAALLLVKPLNALLLGERYATNLGVKIRRTRVLILLCTGLLTATATAFCGPVSFIGLAVPHVARLTLGRADHRMLLPVTMLLGSTMALLCNLLTVIPGTGTVFPLNAVTPIFGAPVIIYVILRRRGI